MSRPVIIHQPLLTFYNSEGNINANGTLEFFEVGTTTPITIYNDSSLSTELDNPLDLNDFGQPVNGGVYTPIWITSAYKLRVKDSDGNIVTTIDNITELGVVNLVVTKTGNYTILQTDKDKIILVDATSGNVTITLPSVITVGSGFLLNIKKIDSSTNTVTVSPVLAQTIDGGPSYVLDSQNEFISIASDTSNWQITSLVVNSTTNILSFASVASAVNTVNVTNAATGNGPIVGVAGSDTNVDLNLTSKGTGTVKINGGSIARGEIQGVSGASGGLRMYEDTGNGTNYVGWKAPSNIASNIEFEMPGADGSANYVLKTNGSGNTAFFDVTTLFTQTVLASLLTQVSAQPGTIRLGSLRINFGIEVFPASTSKTVTYLTAFSSTPYAVVLSPHADFNPYVASSASGSATVSASGSNSNTFSYIAVGPA